ncbi:MAG TPA: MarR family winged helix-turn-helix transcriptional regulator [Caulobacteraceae bacterium]|jgi:DNA-binding MarR family transcriptional regulator|nr:MarR family winged helix-turn-helix transcriptional regulator [Caulobacteraceae bacterium]
MAKLKTKPGGKKSGKKIEAAKALDRSPSHLLHRALQLALDIYAEETGPDAITQRQYAVLSAVAAQEGLTQTDLVKSTGIDRSTLADLVARMIGKGLLGRQRSAADARANTVSLTDGGRGALDAARPRVAAADARIMKLLPTRKRDAFLDVLREMGRVAAADADEEPGKKKKKAKAQKAAKPARAAKPAKAAKPVKAGKTAKPPKTKAVKAAKPPKSLKVAVAPKVGKKKKTRKAMAAAPAA